MIVVERLTVRVWLSVVWPLLRNKRRAGAPIARCFVIDSTPIAMRLAGAMSRGTGTTVEALAFRLVDVRDERGLLVALRLAYEDLAEIVTDVRAEPLFREFLAAAGTSDRLAAAVTKSVATVSLVDRATLWRFMLLVGITEWKARMLKESAPTLVAERRAWMTVLTKYAAAHGVTVSTARPAFHPAAWVMELAGRRLSARVRAWRDRRAHGRLIGRPRPVESMPATRATLAVQYSGMFNVDDPSRYSDLFFWQESQLPGRDIVGLFEIPSAPLDKEKWEALQRHEIQALALYPGAATVADVPLYAPSLPLRASARERQVRAGITGRSREARWLRDAVSGHEVTREYWRELFQRTSIRMFISWYRYDAKHFAIADALQAVGGVTAIYQRAQQFEASPQIAVNADLMFGYAPADAEVERRSGSVIPYHVAVGYFGDHRFPRLKTDAGVVRARLLARGATFVIAYFDENSAEDDRWHTGHRFMQENYQFILERVLADTSLGLVLKPKVPSTLRRRLGPVAELLTRALATGRCYFHDEGPLHGSLPPAAAAMAADLAIHGHLAASTAGLEAALCGVPTLLLDREGWAVSPMYSLGLGRVAFTDWPEMWRAVSAQRKNPGAIEGFGDWSAMIDAIDPFRDGGGATRIGTYLQWVLDGLNANRSRDAVLAEAAERYAAAWGADKITRVEGLVH